MKKVLYGFILVCIITLFVLSINNEKEVSGYLSNAKTSSIKYSVSQRIIKEVMKDYYIKGPKFQYNYAKTLYGGYSPEEATSQDTKYLVCAAYTYAVYKEAFGMQKDDNGNDFPRVNSDILKDATNYYGKNKKCNNNFLIYYEENGRSNKCISGNNYTYSSFVQKLKPGDLISSGESGTGHAMIVYDVVKRGNTYDALVLNSSKTGTIQSRIGFGTSKIMFDNFKPKISNDLITISKEGTLKFLWLSEYKKFVKNGKVQCTLSGGKCTIIRPFYENSAGKTVFNYAYDVDQYKISKMRTNYPGIYIEKTVDKGDNNRVYLGDKLVYTIAITNRSKYDKKTKTYDDFYIEEYLDDNVTFVSSAKGSYSNGVIKWKVSKLKSDETVKLTYTVLVNNIENNVNKLVTSKGKFYDDESTKSKIFLTTGTVQNRITTKISSYNDSYSNCYNSLSKKYSGINLVNKVVECSTGLDILLNKFNFANIISKKADAAQGTTDAIALSNLSSNGTTQYALNSKHIDMILNDYWGGLVNFRGRKNQVNLPKWGGNKSILRNRNINKSDFKDGDILIYEVSDNTGSAKANGTQKQVTFTTEKGLYAFIYIGGEFIGVNYNGTSKQRNKFTMDYYNRLKKENKVDLNLVFYNQYDRIKDNKEILENLNYNTLFDKDYFVILRPELVMKETTASSFISNNSIVRMSQLSDEASLAKITFFDPPAREEEEYIDDGVGEYEEDDDEESEEEVTNEQTTDTGNQEDTDSNKDNIKPNGVVVPDNSTTTPDNAGTKDSTNTVPDNSSTKDSTNSTPDNSETKDNTNNVPDNSETKDNTNTLPENNGEEGNVDSQTDDKDNQNDTNVKDDDEKQEEKIETIDKKNIIIISVITVLFIIFLMIVLGKPNKEDNI